MLVFCQNEVDKVYYIVLWARSVGDHLLYKKLTEERYTEACFSYFFPSMCSSPLEFLFFRGS